MFEAEFFATDIIITVRKDDAAEKNKTYHKKEQSDGNTAVRL